MSLSSTVMAFVLTVAPQPGQSPQSYLYDSLNPNLIFKDVAACQMQADSLNERWNKAHGTHQDVFDCDYRMVPKDWVKNSKSRNRSRMY